MSDRPSTIKWLKWTYPVIAWLDATTALVAHENGPALCDGNWLSTISPLTGDKDWTTTLKMKACDAYREWSWPQLKAQFYPLSPPVVTSTPDRAILTKGIDAHNLDAGSESGLRAGDNLEGGAQ
jgi:hypothetical protein